MKKGLLFLLSGLIAFSIQAKEINIKKVIFEGVNISQYKHIFTEAESQKKFNIVFSSILPPDGIYKIIETNSGKEAIIQIGYYMANTPPRNLYLPDHLYHFFISDQNNKKQTVQLKIKFLGWGKNDDQSEFINIESLVIKPDQAAHTIKKRGLDKYYIQLGSYEYYQNSFPKIAEMLPYLEVRPNFFMVRYLFDQGKDNGTLVYRVLAGPYSKEDANSIVKIIRKIRDETIFMKSAKSIIKEEKK